MHSYIKLFAFLFNSSAGLLVLSSLSDRKPVEREDELVVMVVPDYQMLEYVERIAADLSDDPVWACVLIL